jgi:hypothetical protein
MAAKGRHRFRSANRRPKDGIAFRSAIAAQRTASLPLAYGAARIRRAARRRSPHGRERRLKAGENDFFTFQCREADASLLNP